MAFVAVLDACRAKYEGRTQKNEVGASFCILVKDDGATVVQALETGVRPDFWNAGGRIEVFVAGGRMLFRSFSHENETLEIEGAVRLLSNANGSGYRVQVSEVDALPATQIPADPPLRHAVVASAPATVRRPSQTAPHALDATQRAKLAELREWRTRRSRELGLPPYVLARDDTLVDLVLAWPKDIHALSVVKGMGPKRCAQFGDELISLFAS